MVWVDDGVWVVVGLGCRVTWLRRGVGCGGDKAKGGGEVIDSSVVVKSACRGGRCVLERAPTPHV